MKAKHTRATVQPSTQNLTRWREGSLSNSPSCPSRCLSARSSLRWDTALLLTAAFLGCSSLAIAVFYGSNLIFETLNGFPKTSNACQRFGAVVLRCSGSLTISDRRRSSAVRATTVPAVGLSPSVRAGAHPCIVSQRPQPSSPKLSFSALVSVPIRLPQG